MDTSYQNNFFKRSDSQITCDPLPFETVLIKEEEEEFEVFDPTSPNQKDIIMTSTIADHIFNGNENNFLPDINYRNYVTSDSCKKLLLPTGFGNKTGELLNSDSNTKASKDLKQRLKSKVRALMGQECPKDNLHRMDEVIWDKKQVFDDVLNIKTKGKKCDERNLLPSTLNISSQIESQTPDINVSNELCKISEQNYKSPKQQLFTGSTEYDIDCLKMSIIDASRALIKTEKSLRVQGKLLRGEVIVQKQEAVSHLKLFQNTLKIFRKTISGIDKSLLTRCRDLFPEKVQNSNLSNDTVNCQKSAEGIVSLESLLGSDKRFEIIIPSSANKENGEISNCDQINDQNSLEDGDEQKSLSNYDIQEMEPNKRRKISSQSPISRKCKTRIIHHNWYSKKKENLVKIKRFHNEDRVQKDLPLCKVSSEPIIILD